MTSIYLDHVEERLEWVAEIAGLKIAEASSSRVPILWRGCAGGCLDFLEEEGHTSAETEMREIEEEEEAHGDGFDVDEIGLLGDLREEEVAGSDDSFDLELEADANADACAAL